MLRYIRGAGVVGLDPLPAPIAGDPLPSLTEAHSDILDVLAEEGSIRLASLGESVSSMTVAPTTTSSTSWSSSSSSSSCSPYLLFLLAHHGLSIPVHLLTNVGHVGGRRRWPLHLERVKVILVELPRHHHGDKGGGGGVSTSPAAAVSA